MAFKANVPSSFKIVCASNNIPTAPSSAAGSRAYTGLLSNAAIGYSHLQVNNETAGRLKIIFVEANQAVPSDATSTQSVFVPATSVILFDNINVLDTIYVCSDTGSAIALATVELAVW